MKFIVKPYQLIAGGMVRAKEVDTNEQILYDAVNELIYEMKMLEKKVKDLERRL